MAAEPVVDLVGIEPVRLQVVRTRVQRENVGRKKAQQKAFAAAVRTVAADGRTGEIGIDGKANSAAMPATLERHGGLLVYEETARYCCQPRGGSSRKTVIVQSPWRVPVFYGAHAMV